ncbi:hypothetical protein NPIL_214841 [Nephila pilipes]|uniref:Uncharacterized protein n=1 Tax=Nephila pilipes TaxID=299642 RepID=A0A8X6N958_NEPPI|nr:hypothetical protein NPIL_214841 [Nephila pilipes]
MAKNEDNVMWQVKTVAVDGEINPMPLNHLKCSTASLLQGIPFVRLRSSGGTKDLGHSAPTEPTIGFSSLRARLIILTSILWLTLWYITARLGHHVACEFTHWDSRLAIQIELFGGSISVREAQSPPASHKWHANDFKINVRS